MRQGERGYLTVVEVAAILRVSRATVYRMCREGALEFMRVSNAIRFVARGFAPRDGSPPR